jgi:hypothetical protein
MTSPYCQHCGFQPPDPVAYHERTAELAAANEEIQRLRKLVEAAYQEGLSDGQPDDRIWNGWADTESYRELIRHD